jgi:hypothetical protein
MRMLWIALAVSLLSCETASPGETNGGVLTDDDLRALADLDDGIEDATDIFEQIFARLTPGATLVIPPGHYRIVRTLRLPPVDLTVRGSGQFSTYLIMDFPDGTGNFLEWHEQGTRPTRAGIELTDLTLLARSVQTGENAAAVSFSYADANVFTDTVKVERVRISPDFTFAYPAGRQFGKFETGLVFTNVRQGFVGRSWVFGLTDAAPDVDHMGNIGILMLGECTDFRVENSVLFQWKTGIVTQGMTEGLQLYQNSIVFTGVGVAYNGPGEPGFVAIANNFNTGVAGIILLSPLSVVITGNTFFANDTTPSLNVSGNYVGLDIRQGFVGNGIPVESRGNKLTENMFFRDGSIATGGRITTSGIILNSRLKTTLVSGNNAEDYDGPLVHLGPLTHHNIVKDNIGERVTVGVIDEGTANLVRDNVKF